MSRVLFRFHDHWKFIMQRLSYLAALICYLQTEKLITREETAQMLGGNVCSLASTAEILRSV